MSASTESSANSLPAIRRVITGHSKSGKSTFVHDGPTPSRFFQPDNPNSSNFHNVFFSNETPASNGTPGEGFVDPTVGKEKEIVIMNGSKFGAADFAPGGVTPFHRTLSIDYVVVTHGSIICQLDDGERVTLNAGDAFVQRGTIHAWINESKTEWARIFYVMLPSEKVQVEGKTLEMEFNPPPKV